MKLSLASLATLSFTATALAEEFFISWGDVPNQALDVVEGDVITFLGSPAHNVEILLDGVCDGDTTLLFADTGKDNGEDIAVLTVNEATLGAFEIGDTIILADTIVDATDHCEQDEIILTLTIVEPEVTDAPTFAPTLSPTTTPTLTPTDSPTVSPTAAPVVTIVTPLAWALPKDLKRFFQKALVVDQTTLFFDVVGTHNLFEFPSKEAFDTCNFTEATTLSLGGETVAVEDFVSGGQTRWFGCDIELNGVKHCADGGQKLAVNTIERGQTLRINWFNPAGGNQQVDIDSNIDADTILEFVLQDAANDRVMQIPTKEEFDACDFTNALRITTQQGAIVTHHDLFIESEPILWFASDNTNGATEANACLDGQKIAVGVNLVNDDDDDDDDDGNDDGDNLAIIVVGIVAVIAIVAALALFLTRGRSTGRGAALSQIDSKPAPNGAEDVATTPYGKKPDQGTPSLAREKAAISGLNF